MFGLVDRGGRPDLGDGAAAPVAVNGRVRDWSRGVPKRSQGRDSARYEGRQWCRSPGIANIITAIAPRQMKA